MPEWLSIVLGLAGGFNLVGLFVWVVKQIYELRNRTSLIEAEVVSMRASCTMCVEDKREIFNKLNRLNCINAAIATKLRIDPGDYEG